jgi:hypothetical protein
MTALRAPIDPGLRLIRGPRLPKHPKGLIVSALGALDLCLRKRRGVRVDNRHFLLPELRRELLVLPIHLLLLSTLAALEHTILGEHQ